MDHCPHCGTELDARLVAAIRNPSMTESCPQRPKKRQEQAPPRQDAPPLNRLATLMLIGSIVRDGLSS